MALSFSEHEERARAHGILASVAFLIIVPLGVLIPRYLRTFSNRWWWAHWLINLLVAAPLIFAGWAMAKSANNISQLSENHHSPVYCAISVWRGHPFRSHPVPLHPPSATPNYLHAGLGLLILALAGYQTHDGLYHQWEYATDNVHPVKRSLKNAWLALLLVIEPETKLSHAD
ncbi:hypothetical protein F5148DRAFT_1147824 [Russula earlei]|uniref:Uncharacterized protein n=1 Tax=Russula earlei TaxID=71964 RepID=A0ACC0UEP9_9AGAM|nr:hypothetical protein F5148DRAFT_1147824 [Russula earlei]